MGLAAWLAENWFTFLQSIGIITGLCFSGASFRLSAEAHRLTQIHNITAGHRDLWSKVLEKPELARILEPAPDLDSAPISLEEERFVTLLILHLQSVFKTIRLGGMQAPSGLKSDIRGFMALPIPNLVWNKIQNDQEWDFVQFVLTCISTKG